LAAKKSPDKVSKATKKDFYEDIIKELINHSIKLQEKNAEMVSAVNSLVNKMTEMVELFEDAANHIKSGTDEPLVRKLEVLLEQNKNIARGLIFLEKYVRDKALAGTGSGLPKQMPKSQF
jgi:P2-related tail formation protein